MNSVLRKSILKKNSNSTTLVFLNCNHLLKIFKQDQFRIVQKKLKHWDFVGFEKCSQPGYFFSYLSKSHGPQLGTLSAAFKRNFIRTRRTGTSPERKSTQQYQLKLFPQQKGQGWHPVPQGSRHFFHWQVFNWTFWESNVMYADANVWRVVYSVVCARQASTPSQHTASHYSAGLSF